MIKHPPKPHQIEGAKFLLSKSGSGLGFKTGMGKTFTTLLACDIALKKCPEAGPPIIFAPKNAIDKVWGDRRGKPGEIAKHTDWKPAAKLPDILSGKVKLEDCGAVLVKYSQVRRNKLKTETQRECDLDNQRTEAMLAELCRERITVFDELHALKNPKAKRTKVCANLVRGAKVRWGLTATAMLNSPLDLYGCLDFLNPGCLGTEWDFKLRFAVMGKRWIFNKRFKRKEAIDIVKDWKNLDDLAVIRSWYIMGAEQDIDVEFHRVEYTLTKDEDDHYLDAADGCMTENHKQFSARLPDLQRVVDGSLDDEGESRVGFRSSKYKAYLPFLKKVLCQNQSAIVFCEYHYTLDMLRDLLAHDLPGVPLFTISGKKVEDPDTFPCITLATAGGSESLNLKFANHVFFYSVPFSVGQFIQTLGRITRMDSEYLDDLHTYLPFNDTTIDYYKTTLLERHTAVIQRILGQDANLPKEVKEVRYELIEEMRKQLLWRTKHG